jgi:predicted nucleic acid-binding Zn ribbon protein
MSSLPCASPDEGGETGPLGDLVKKVIKGLGGKGRLTEEEMLSAWGDAVGPDAARHSRPVSLRRGCVFVNVDRSGWLYELATKKREILERLAARFGGKKLRDIRFRIGEITNKEKKDEREEG